MYIVHLMVKYKQSVRSKQKQVNVKLLRCFIIFCVDLCEPSLLQCSHVLLGNCHNVSNIKSNTGNECMYTHKQSTQQTIPIVLPIMFQNFWLLY